MEKKNINIGVVRTCTILLLTVFTIGRKYGEEQKATDLINNLKQQPCACCLTFDNVDGLVQRIDNKKQELEGKKQELEREIQKKNDEKKLLQTENEKLCEQINILKNGNLVNVGAAQVAKELDLKWSDYARKLSELNVYKEKLENNIRGINAEKINLGKELNENKQILQGKILELDNTKKEIDDLKKIKEKIESDLKIKNENIEKYKTENNQLIEEKTKFENELKEMEDKYKKKYESTVANYEEVVKKNIETVGKYTEEIKKNNDLLEKWKEENENLKIDINEKKGKIENLNEKIKGNKLSIDELNKEKNELKKKCEEFNKSLENLKEKYNNIKWEKISLENQLNVCMERLKEVIKEKESLAGILKTTQTNVNIEELVKFYSSIFAEKKTKIDLLLHTDGKDLMEKKYTFYIPFKFKDCGKHLKKKEIEDLFGAEAGSYKDSKTLRLILKSFVERCAFDKFKENKIINVTDLKELYFYAILPYNDDKDKTIKINSMTNNVLVFNSTSFTPIKKHDKKNFKNNINYVYFDYDEILMGGTYEKYKNMVHLDYSALIELVKIDEYLKEKEECKDNKDLFLLELNFKDPECIALLEFVGKGNYGVVKKGLTFDNGKLVTKAVKFTCTNDLFENSFEKNILKEIRAGKIINEIGVCNKIAFVQDYMKIDKFIQRYYYEEKLQEISSMDEESINGTLKTAVYTTLLNDNLKTLPSGKENVCKDFKNNVFSMTGKIGNDLYIMFMDLVNGKDLFLNEEKGKIDFNNLGKMLFDVLNNLYINGVALKDIKPKNIIWDEKKNKFSIIDVQTLGLVDSDLTDCCGTPELWPFFKTLNLDLQNNNKTINNDNKDDLYDRFCNSIDNNFVDIYAACMTMYFAKFSTYTAAGLLTLLLKWIVLEKENKEKNEWKNFSLDEKIKFLQNYNDNYKKYINLVSGDKDHISKNLVKGFNKDFNDNKIKNNISGINIKKDECSDIIIFFFEEIDDKNLNDNQKKDLAKLLKQVIYHENESKIFYLLDKIREKIGKKDEVEDLSNDDFNNIITFYKQCVKNDFGNFAILDKDKCNYADVIKYVLCYGSCLNYNVGKEEIKVDGILGELKLKDNIKINDEEFFDATNGVIKDVINKLKNGFNQKFIIELLNILTLEEYDDILNHCVSKDSVNYYFKSKIDSLKEKNKKDEIEKIEKQKNVFYLLRYLDRKKLFHIPKNILKINSLIIENTNNKLVEKKNVSKE